MILATMPFIFQMKFKRAQTEGETAFIISSVIQTGFLIKALKLARE